MQYGPGCPKTMLRSALHWNWQFRPHFRNLNFQNLREVSHTRSQASFSPPHLSILKDVKASFSHLLLSDLEGCLSQQPCFHLFHLHFLKDLWHKSFVFTSSTFTFLRGLAHKLRFHIFQCHFLRRVWEESFVFMSSTFTF